MSALGHMLDDREDPLAREARRLDADRAAVAWQLRGERPEVRLVAYDRWVRAQLATRLDWAWAGAQRERRIEQCRIELERMVLALWQRGWELDGKVLAGRITGMLDAVAAYQRKGRVEDFWAYFSAACRRYVGQNAEEIDAEARRIGGHVGALVAFLKPQQGGPTLPALVAERAKEVEAAKEQTLREKVSRERAKQGADDAQLGLF